MARYLYTLDGQPLPEPICISHDWSDAPRQPLRVDVSYMDGLTAVDGTDISSKRKRRAYMDAKGLADTSDFTNTWAKAEKERAEYFSGQKVDPKWREAIGRAEYEHSKKRRK